MSDFAIPWAVEAGPDESELEQLVEGPASQTLTLAPPWVVLPPPVAAPEELLDADQVPDGPRIAGPPVAAGAPDDAAHATEVMEAAWKSDAHPRWPKGTPGGKGGEWIKVGEHFTSGGKEWEVAHIVHGRIYAHEASGKYTHTELREFKTAPHDEVGTHVPGIEHKPPTTVPQGGKTHSNVTVVDAYVDGATHDPSIPIPEHSPLTPAEWGRFGRVDQEHYSELMSRFGKHKPGAAKAHVDKAYAEYQHSVQALVKAAYQQQYGSSSGFSLAIAAGGKHSYGGHGVHDTPEMAKLREQALALQGEHKAAVQWDLYNRTKSPDMFVVHKDSDHGPDWWHQEFIAGERPVMPGLSQSFSYRRSFFGSHAIATPLAIRHVLMSTASAQPIPGSTHFPGELEVATSEQLKLDHRSIAFTSAHGKNTLSASQIAWLEGMTNEPIGGHVLDQLRDSIEHGTYLPPPPKPPKITMNGANGKTWVDPTPEMAKPPFDTSALPKSFDKSVVPSELPKGLPWTNLDEHGNPRALTGKDAGVKSGQYFMGLKGTLYWVGPDPGNTTGYPYRIHKITDGAFNGEDFAYNPDLPGYYLDAHLEMPKVDESLPDWHPEQWVKSIDSKFIDQFEAGEKFKLDGTSYEVVGSGVNGQVNVMDLESGLKGQINGDYKTAWLVPYGGPGADPADLSAKPHAAGDVVRTPFGIGHIDAVDDTPGVGGGQIVHVTHLGHDHQMEFSGPEVSAWAPHTKAAPGVTFAHEGKKAVVTKIRKDGTIQANLKPGQLLISPEDWDAQHAQLAFDPAAHHIAEQPTKLRDMKVGDRFQGGAGNQTMRPYEVVYADEALKVVRVRNIDTGELSELSKHQSYRSLLENKDDAPPASLEAAKGTPAEVTGPGHVGPAFDPAKWEHGDTMLSVHDAPVGSYMEAIGGGVVHIDAQTGDETTVTWVHGGGTPPGTSMTLAVVPEAGTLHVLQLKGDKPDALPPHEPPPAPADAATGFDPSSYVEGQLTKIGHMPGGTMFKTNGKKGPAYYQLSDDGTKTTNLATGKVYDAKPHWKATPLTPPDTGERETVTLKDAQPGDVIHLKDGGKVQVGSAAAQESAPHGMVHVHAPGAGDVKGVPVPGELPGYKIGSQPHDSAPAQPLKDKFPVGDVAVFTKDVQEQLGKDGGYIVGYGENGDVWVKMHGGEQVAVQPDEVASVTDHGNFAEAQLAKAEIAHAEAGSSDAPVVTQEKLPNGKFRYRVDGEVITKSSNVDYKSASFWHYSDGVHGPTLHKGEDTADKATKNPSNPHAGPKAHAVKIVPYEGEQAAPVASGKTAVSSPLGTNAKGKTFGELQPGAVFSPAHNGIQYQKAAPGVLASGDNAVALTGPSAGAPHTFEDAYVPDDLHSEPATAAHVGQLVSIDHPGHPASPSLGGPVQKTGYVAKVNELSGAVQLHGSVKWFPPESVTVHDEQLPGFQGGDQVQLASGAGFPDVAGPYIEGAGSGVKGTFVGWGTDTSGQPVALVDTTGNMDVAEFPPGAITAATPGTGEEQQGVPLTSKAHTPTPYDQLQQGDATTLAKLKVGDQAMVSGQLVQVDAEPYTSGHETFVFVREVGPGGKLGMDYPMAVDATATLHAKAADTVAVSPPPAVDASELPDAVLHGGFTGMLVDPGSGMFAQLGQLPVGTQVQDAGGKKWIVKRAGASPVISNGHDNYGLAVSGDWVLPLQPNELIVDHADPVGGGGESIHVQAAKADLVPNEGMLPLGDMSLKPGDFVTLDGGKVHEFLHGPEGGGAPGGGGAGHYVFVDVSNGKPTTKGYLYHPSKASPGAFIDTSAATLEPDAPPTGLPAPSLYTVPVDASEVTAFPGNKVTLAPGSTVAYDVVAKHGGGGIVLKQEGEGDTISMLPGETVYQPEPQVPAVPSEEPPPTTIDPASEGFAVHGPADFSNPQPAPLMDPNFSGDSPLQPFSSRKGPGGVYDYVKLDTLQPGQRFSDKSGIDYRLVAQGSGTSVFENIATGQQFGSPSSHRVKLTALPPDPGPQLKPVVNDLVHKYGDLENVPTLGLTGFDHGAVGTGGKAKYPRLGHLSYGDIAYDADGHQVVFLGSWLDRALVLEVGTNEAYLANAATRITKG